MRLLLASVLALALGVGLLIAGGAGATTNSADDKAASTTRADFSGLVDIGGGRKIYMTCRGKGSPTVVLVSGGRNAADAWSVTADPKNERAVFDEVAKFTRVCAYDRPGTIRQGDKLSPPTPVEQPTSAKPAAADLDALLGRQGNRLRTCSPDTPSAGRSSGSTPVPIPPRWADSSSSTPSPKTFGTG